MAVTLDDLLTDAQEQVWRAAQALPADPEQAHRRAGEVVDEHVAAWPAVLDAAERTFFADAPHRPRPELRAQETWAALQATRAVLRASPADRTPDPGLVDAAARLGAAADAMAQGTAPAPATLDRVLAIVESSARVTAIYAEQLEPRAQRTSAHDPALWRHLADVAGAAVTTDPLHRAAVTSMRPLVAEATSLQSTMERWARQAADLLEPTRTPSADLPVIARGLQMIHHAALATGGPSEHGLAAQAWREAGDAWGPTVRIPGAFNRDLRDATRSLRVELAQLAHQHREGAREQLTAVLDLRIFSADRALALAGSYGAQIDHVIVNELAVGVARPIAVAMGRVGQGDHIPPALMRAATRPVSTGRGWAVLPAASPQARTISDTAREAVIAASSPAIAGAGEAAAAMKTSSAGFGLHPTRPELITAPAPTPEQHAVAQQQTNVANLATRRR